ncbi:MAG: hypothetical protein ACT4O1_14840 [Gemmatimonadota bacterium]
MPWTDTRPRDPFVDASGRVWFVGQVGNYLAHLDPKSGEFKRFAIEDGTLPQIWFGTDAGTIGRARVP